MTYGEYQEIIENNLNWSKADVNRLTCECYLKKLTLEETLETIKEFKEKQA